MSTQHFLSIEQLDRPQLLELMDQTAAFLHASTYPKLLEGKVVSDLFFEPSTRTRLSFDLAAKRLGAYTLNFDPALSSTKKGESLIDTVKTVAAMGTNIMVVRHAENGIPAFIAKMLPHVSVINAGDGTQNHPTQALLDVFTIAQHKPDFTKLRVGFMGDIRHSRVAQSTMQALHCLGTPDIHIIAPPSLLPEPRSGLNIKTYTDPEQGLRDLDIIITLRLQKERMLAAHIPDETAYFEQYGLTPERLALAKPDALVMHPGPMNREVEIAGTVADGLQSVILEQVHHGVFARMAVMAWCARN